MSCARATPTLNEMTPILTPRKSISIPRMRVVKMFGNAKAVYRRLNCVYPIDRSYKNDY